MPLTEFEGGEEYLLRGARAGKRSKRETYRALADLRSQERAAVQEVLDKQNKARKESPLLGMGRRFAPSNIKQTGPKDISIEDYESGNISSRDYMDLMARFRGQDPRVTRGLAAADALGLTSAARTLIGEGSSFAGAGGMLLGAAAKRLVPDNKYKYVFDEYGQNVGTGAYTTAPSKTDPIIAALTVTPGKGISPAMRSLMGAAKAVGQRAPRPVTAGVLAGAGAAGVAVTQPEEAEAAKISIWKAALKDTKQFSTMANRAWNERLRGDLRKLIAQGALPEGSRRDIMYQQELAQPAYRPRFLSDRSILPAQAPALARTFFNKNKAFVKNNPDEELVWGHDVSRASGGPTTSKNLFLVPERTNVEMRDMSFKDFVSTKAKETGRTKRQIAADYGILHTNWK
jgi:hypothetical protein